jgi:hypothetical protein
LLKILSWPTSTRTSCSEYLCHIDNVSAVYLFTNPFNINSRSMLRLISPLFVYGLPLVMFKCSMFQRRPSLLTSSPKTFPHLSSKNFALIPFACQLLLRILITLLITRLASPIYLCNLHAFLLSMRYLSLFKL